MEDKIKEDKLKISYNFLKSIWDDAPKDITPPKVLFLFYQNKIYTVIDDSSSVYFVASKDKQILAIARTKAPVYTMYGVKIYNVEDSGENVISALKIVSCNKIQNKKQKFVIENIAKYI
jgi:hypothetical protein